MYCPTCGVAVTQGLSFCNFCGAKLEGTNAKSSEPKAGLLVSAMAGVFIMGVFVITMLMGMMKSVLGLPVERVLALTLIPFLLLLLIEGVIIRLLLRRTRETEEPGDTPLSKKHATKELDAAQARALPEHVPSVTEHTTRTFDPGYNPVRDSER